MNSKKAKTLRKLVDRLIDKEGLQGMGLLAKNPTNRSTAIVHPKSPRGVIKAIKRSIPKGK